jgi:hypothetical protein
MTNPETRLVVWEAGHDNGWTTIVMEQPDGTFVAWAGEGNAIGPRCSRWEKQPTDIARRTSEVSSGGVVWSHEPYWCRWHCC